MDLDHVPRRPRIGGHDRGFATRQAIEQRRLAGVGRPRDRDPEAVAQALAALRPSERLADLPLHAARDFDRLRDELLRDIALVRKIDPGLDQRQRLDQPRAPGLGAVAQETAQLPERLAALRLASRPPPDPQAPRPP